MGLPEEVPEDSLDPRSHNRLSGAPPDRQHQLFRGVVVKVQIPREWMILRVDSAPTALRPSAGHPSLLDRQPVPPFRPPALQDLLPVDSTHPLQEAVRLLPLALVWLVGPLHGGASIWKGKVCYRDMKPMSRLVPFREYPPGPDSHRNLNNILKIRMAVNFPQVWIRVCVTFSPPGFRAPRKGGSRDLFLIEEHITMPGYSSPPS